MASDQGSQSPSEFVQLPERLPVLPLTDTVLFPHSAVPISIKDRRVAEQLTESDYRHQRLLLVAVRPGRDSAEESPGDPPFFGVGTSGSILQLLTMPDESVRMIVQGQTRLRIREFLHERETWFARVEPAPDDEGDDARIKALHRTVLQLFQEIISHQSEHADSVGQLLEQVEAPGQIADFICAHLNLELEDKQRLLEERRVDKRLERVAEVLGEERKVLEYGHQIQEKLQGEVEKTQREYFLREQMKIIKQELGEEDEDDAARLRREIEASAMPDPAREQAERELKRLERTVPQAGEYHVIQNYLEWMVALPWSRTTEETIDVDRAREVLDRDHYDLEDVKERIAEFLAVRKLNPDLHGPILCFVGPPGVGKTSLGRSIAEALGREFTRASLGGIRDEAEIRGHRRTYVGALPGRIIQGVRQVGVRNPVFMLDEIDKVGQDFRGDPTSALLEALDPAQNHNFSDHYLEVSFDLSQVMFIATANTLTTVPPALRDRLEVLELPGYTANEKVQIARQFLIERQMREAGLSEAQVEITDDAVERTIRDHTREAGVRELERQIARIMRKVALHVVEEGDDGADERADPVRVTEENLADYAGKRRFEQELAGRADEIGTATALAFTPAGGQILFVEAVRLPGEGEIRLTGQLGDVMKESAQAALSYVRAKIAPEPESGSRHDIHVHVPAGAMPKDGPSAGVALVVALASLLTGRRVRRDVAMMGEVTLRGHVLPVGGINEKLIAAAQAGIDTVLVPKRNEVDLDDITDEVRDTLELVLIENAGDALDHALVEEQAGGGAEPQKAAS